LVKEETAGDPMSELKWQRSSLRHLKDELAKAGYWVSHTTIGRLLKEMKYSLKANVKRLSGASHPDREQQFAYIARQKAAFLAAGLPVISVDTKKKELIGNFKNPGQSWRQEPAMVNDHDFEQDALGESADTPEFAVDSIAHWWLNEGQLLYPLAKQLLILADAGGSNGCRPRLWKLQLQEQLADRLQLQVTVCHYPTGASKWNPIEHRLFGPITINWAAQPLRSFEFMLATMRGTVTETGLQVKASLVKHLYRKGIKVTKAVMETLRIDLHPVCPRWNYTIKPRLLSL
jgi:hypothetical protein